MVIVIIGLMVGGGLTAIGPITQQTRLNTTNASLDQIEAALTAFVIRNNRLPCPADGSLVNSVANSATYGIEAAQAGDQGAATDLTADSCTVTATNSVVPWRTLGLNEAYSLDGWSNRIAYFPAVGELNGVSTGWNTLVDDGPAYNGATMTVNCLNRIAATTLPSWGYRSNALSASGASACDPVNTITAASGTNTYGTYTPASFIGYAVPTYPFGNYIPIYGINNNACSTELTQPNTDGTSGAYGVKSGAADNCQEVQAAASITVQNYMFDGQRAAYVLISHGPSGWYAWTRQGTQIQPPAATYTLKKYNSGIIANLAGPGSPNNGFVQGTTSSTNLMAKSFYFDDILRWRSPAFIIQQCGAGACGNP